jgi:hypothetical protein
MAGPWEKYAQQESGPWDKFSAQDAPQPKPADKAGAIENFGMGALKGASDIGATLLRPVDFALNKLGVTETTNADRRASLDDFFKQRSDVDSYAFRGGDLAASVAGTAGVGGLLGKGALAVGKVAPSIAPQMATLAAALESGGFRTTPLNFVGPQAAPTIGGRVADAALRTAAGGAVGAAAAGLVNPADVGTGAAIGAAMPGAVKLAGMAGSGAKNAIGSLAQNVLGVTTGAGSKAIETAYQAGKSGNDDFLRNLRGKGQMEEVLDQAKTALNNMRIERGNVYRQNMAGVTADKTVLDMQPIIDAVDSVRNMGTFKGQVIKKNAAGTVDEIANQVAEWQKLNPVDFHTPEGLDALKQAIGDIRDATQFGTPARKAADSVYNAVKDQITKQAPEYAKTMKQYSEASDLITEIQRALSLGEKASADTGMRKLQSLMRNNVNTNYGNRLDLMRELEQQGGANVMPSIAGQALSSNIPRGLQGAVFTVNALTPSYWAALPFQSPRLVGEAAYGLGQMAGGGQNALRKMANGPRVNALLTEQPYLPLMTVGPAVYAADR